MGPAFENRSNSDQFTMRIGEKGHRIDTSTGGAGGNGRRGNRSGRSGVDVGGGGCGGGTNVPAAALTAGCLMVRM